MTGTYNCSACRGDTPCCWENPAEQERSLGVHSGHGDPPRGVVWRWRLRWWPLRVHLRVRWGSLAKAHRGLRP